MATIITSDCINCGACEPECPNTAIYGGGVPWELNGAQHPALAPDIYYIVAQKCTECVGFYDHEACAAVCPVDCCVTDPKNVESEEVLLQRARELHPGKDFGTEIPSRFRKEGGVEASPNGGAPAEAHAAVAPAPAAAAAPAAKAAAAPEVSEEFDPATWAVPVRCHYCNERYEIPYGYFQAGAVFYCPNCSGSFVPTTQIFRIVKETFEGFYGRRLREREAFERKQAREREVFEARKTAEMDIFGESLESLAERIKPAGKLVRRRGLGSMFS